MKILTVIFLFIACLLPAADKPLGIFTAHGDVGPVKKAGTISYQSATGSYLIGGSGFNMWEDKDEFHFVWKKVSGDFIAYGRMNFIGQGVELHRKIGWIARSSLETSAPYADAAVHGDGLTSLQFRRQAGGLTDEVIAKEKGPVIVQLERRGNTFIMMVAKTGEPLHEAARTDIDLPQELYVGLFVCSHNSDVFEEAVFSNIRLTIPAPAAFKPYEDYGASRLEIMNIFSLVRTVLYTSKEALEAPNWTRDGKTIIYNSQGLLYRLDLADPIPQVIPTDFAKNINNDHVLSPDGKFIGLSHHTGTGGDNDSAVFIVPITGGVPKPVTEKSPSYLHGWSPNGKYLLYTAEREGEFDIYSIKADGGPETRLTTAKCLDDGSEYSSDGKTIYFNSCRSGKMNIWKMKADGSKSKHLTNDQYNDWFPHVSPDGRWIVFLSFPAEVAPDDHPFYKQVLLRIMPVKGGKPKVIAHLYGGQGTINVPSWSPDSQKICFASYTFGDPE